MAHPSSIAPPDPTAQPSVIPFNARAVFIFTVVWRLLMTGLGILAFFWMPRSLARSTDLIHNEHWALTPLNLVIDIAYRDDAGWYGSIVQHGYHFSTHALSSIAFYPLYPLTVKALSYVVPNVPAASLIVSLLALLAAMPLFASWMQDRGVGNRALLGCAFLLLFPFAYFYAADYTEPLYLLLAVGAFLACERRQWWLAALCTFLIALSRPTGIIVVPCLAVLLWERRERDPRALAPLLAGPAALALFALYQWHMFGTPFAAADAAAVWQRRFLQFIPELMMRPEKNVPTWWFLFMEVIGVLFLAAVPMVYRRFGAAYALFAALSVIVPALFGVMSLQRYVCVDFPVFAALATIRSPRLIFLMLGYSAIFLAFFGAAFVAGWAVF